jgi:iron complex outermembrane receptor protein
MPFGSALAQDAAKDAAAPAKLEPVVVTATRQAAAPFDIPASIERIGAETIGDNRWQVNLSESLGGVPGLLARNRQNYAQDEQISVRGFGARSTFGVRGVRMIVDGIPATMPDGQGQLSHIDLGSAERIEVLRGPFSALYGNSSGGVIQVFTEEGEGPPTLTLSGGAGSDGAARGAAKWSGSSGNVGYIVDASRFRTDGWRDHSAAERNVGNAKLTWRFDQGGKLTLVANSMAMPLAQDPLGLTRAQWNANPRGVDPTAIAFNTRKSVEQTQAGLTYEQPLDAMNAVQLQLYDGHRGTEQFQSIATGPQANPLHPGGVILLGRDYRGADLRWTFKRDFGGQPFSLVAGVARDDLDEHRRGRQNFIGTTLGVEGALRRDENNTVTGTDEYLQASWKPSPRWRVDAGVRHSSVRFDSVDSYIVGTNGDDSGRARFGATLPVAAVMYSASDALHLYAAAGRGFETPTLNEIAYRASGAPGLNFSLQPARSDNLELGVKTRFENIGEANLAFFETRTQHEIVTQTNSGGRSTFQNAGATRRRGAELSWTRQLAGDQSARLAATWLDARYRDAFGTCVATPCTAPTVIIPAGNRIPGTARTSLYAAWSWAPPQGWRAGIEGRWLGRVFVNDGNSESAPGYAVASVNAGYERRWRGWRWLAYARIDNLFDRRYAGSVIVNEGQGRFYEAAPGRTWLLGTTASISF